MPFSQHAEAFGWLIELLKGRVLLNVLLAVKSDLAFWISILMELDWNANSCSIV